MNKIFGYMKEASDDELAMLASDLHTLILDVYFGKYWKGNTKEFSMSGHDQIAKKISDLNPKHILDVGCGYNSLKQYMQTKGMLDNTEFVGIDPFNNNADIMQGICQYWHENQDKQYDTVLALGSINFGTKDKILQEIDCLDKLTAPGGYQFWRVNPGLLHDCPEFPLINLVDFYPWDKAFIDSIANIYNYEIKEYSEELNSNGDKRLYFCFYKY